jgi:hypothetical protein
MRIPATAQAGCVVLLGALTGFFVARYRIESRTLRAVDMPVSLAQGIVSTGPFSLNTHGFYSILIGDQQDGNFGCTIGLETKRLSSIGGLPVYRYKWLEDESRSAGRNTIAEYFLGGFEGKPGRYHLEIEIVSDTVCLNAHKPHLYVLASDDDFYKWNLRYDNFFYAWNILGLLGCVLILASILGAVRERSDNPTIFK